MSLWGTFQIQTMKPFLFNLLQHFYQQDLMIPLADEQNGGKVTCPSPVACEI
jgi:hypothetical protein